MINSSTPSLTGERLRTAVEKLRELADGLDHERGEIRATYRRDPEAAVVCRKAADLLADATARDRKPEVSHSSLTAERLLKLVEPRAKTMRTWGVDESLVDYVGPLGDAWLIVHLADLLADATARAQEQDSLRLELQASESNRLKDNAYLLERAEKAEAQLAAHAQEIARLKGDYDYAHGELASITDLVGNRSEAGTYAQVEAALAAFAREIEKLKLLAVARAREIAELEHDLEIKEAENTSLRQQLAQVQQERNR